MFGHTKNSKKQGDVGLGAAIAYFTQTGATVLLPISDSQDYDLVIDGVDGLKRVQVRTTNYREPSGNFTVSLRLCGGSARTVKVRKTSHQMDYDILFALTSEGAKYLIPKAVFSDVKNSITLSKRFDPYRI